MNRSKSAISRLSRRKWREINTHQCGFTFCSKNVSTLPHTIISRNSSVVSAQDFGPVFLKDTRHNDKVILTTSILAIVLYLYVTKQTWQTDSDSFWQYRIQRMIYLKYTSLYSSYNCWISWNLLILHIRPEFEHSGTKPFFETYLNWTVWMSSRLGH